MDDYQDLYNTRAYAQKGLLQEDLSIRISQAITSAGALYENLVFAETQILNQDTTEEEEQVHAVILTTNNTILKKALSKGYSNIIEARSKTRTTILRAVSPTNYRLFISDFYQLYLESKDQIDTKHWGNDKLGNAIRPQIEALFIEASKGSMDARKALVLFEYYMTALERCGIMYFKSTSLKAGESWRESAG